MTIQRKLLVQVLPQPHKGYYILKRKCCANCDVFDKETRFCRLNPPIPIRETIKESNGYVKQVIVSMFPVIRMPEQDWCSNFKDTDSDDTLLNG